MGQSQVINQLIVNDKNSGFGESRLINVFKEYLQPACYLIDQSMTPLPFSVQAVHHYLKHQFVKKTILARFTCFCRPKIPKMCT